MGLLDAFKQYVRDAMPGGLLNPETQPVADRVQYASGILDPQSQVSQDAQKWHKKTQLGLVDQLAGKETPAAEYAYQQMMNMAGVAPIGMTAWHGSPHKFDKFSLDKIGTGEGAQAYGHGLYLAQEPAVAHGYKMSNSHGVGKYAIDGKDALNAAYQDKTLAPAVRYLQDYGDAKLAKQYATDYGDISAAKKIDELEKSGRLVANPKPAEGNLYKTDIPDEAVARFLDWDKPLSQQAPEVRAALQKGGITPGKVLNWEPVPGANASGTFEQLNGSGLYGALEHQQGGVDGVRKYLSDQGIPGIRYLDGGSRSAGQGSSNFVAFDPEMIRILERNGQATGARPWAPGEYQGLLK